MSDYYISSSNSTFFLSGSKIYSSEGSGSSVDKTNGVEMTKEGLWNPNDNTIIDVLEISKQVSGSYYYVRDTMGF